ncbi:hypothetical protein DL93DRAFT_2123496 [Clavulina sp. PMI_390]|nr:hypothetical protein DL93DRAFT_2123496 [Clavulina sp. PMI_390]
MSSTPAPLDTSPPIHRMQPGDEFNPSLFTRSIPVQAARIDALKTTTITRSDAMKGFMLDIPKMKPVAFDPENDSKRILLLRVPPTDELPSHVKEYLLANSDGIFTYPVSLDYSYWTADEILQAVLPPELLDESPTSFTTTGHIAHMNLRDEYLPWRHLIGKVILEKHKNIRTVVNKLDTIDTQFRFFKMEVLAGNPDFIVEMSESNCRFRFDFSQVYWNSRLHAEHGRLVDSFKATDVVADVFAGVGPFAIPAAKKGCAVYGNDLNPSSAKYMQSNADDNKVASRMQISCRDGREFIRSVAHESWHKPFPAIVGPLKTPRQIEKMLRHQRNARERAEKEANSNTEASKNPTEQSALLPEPEHAQPPPPPRRKVDHFVMNLPGTALEFLDAFRGCLASIKDEPDFEREYAEMPLVHCHCFTREVEENAKADIRQRAEMALGGKIGDDATYHFVRSVAPNKDMWCITFALPRDVALADPSSA